LNAGLRATAADTNGSQADLRMTEMSMAINRGDSGRLAGNLSR
jgi:hypothetical protein